MWGFGIQRDVEESGGCVSMMEEEKKDQMQMILMGCFLRGACHAPVTFWELHGFRS